LVDRTFALDGGAERTKWQRRHIKRKAKAPRARARREKQIASEARYDARQKAKVRRQAAISARARREAKRKIRVASVEKVDKARWQQARKAEGYTLGLPYKDITGQRFGLVVVLRPGGHLKSGSKRWWIQCDCGSPPKQVPGTNLKQGNQRSCGCSVPGTLRARWHSPKYYKRRAVRDAARRKELAKPISYLLLRLRRKFKEGSAEAKLLSRARNLIVWAELQKGIIKPRTGWKTNRYKLAA
jgi:hypothetical protein